MFVYQVVATKCVRNKNKKEEEALRQAQSRKVHLLQPVQALQSSSSSATKL